ncbi:MAG: hypothetical protein RL313_744 [Actinomycetota bacterium]
MDYLNPQAAEIIARAPQSGSGGLDDQVYNRLLRERIIFLGSVVEDSMANAIAAQILLLAAEDAEKDIFLYINSPGGSVTAGMAIYDTMQYVKNDVATVGMGLAASMGQFLLCSGAAGKRYALPHARIMMHQPSSGIGGTATAVSQRRRWLNSLHITQVKRWRQSPQTLTVTVGSQPMRQKSMDLSITLFAQQVRYQERAAQHE